MKNISDEQLRAYFLGSLTEAEAETLEMECAADAVLTERAQTIEGELADDYLRENLSATDAALFEANYLTTEARRTKLRVARGLWQFAREAKPKSAAAHAVGAKSSWQKIFGGQIALKLAFGAFVVLVIAGAIVFYLPGFGSDNRLAAEVKPVNLPAQNENPVIQSPVPETPAPFIAETENTAVPNREVNRSINAPQKNQPAPRTVQQPKTNGQTQPALAVFALLPGTLRDAGEQFITIAPASKNLELRLKLPEDAAPYKTYRVVVKTAEGDSVFTASGLRLSNFTIPAEKLENRTYMIFLEGKNTENEFESVAEYSFRVRR